MTMTITRCIVKPRLWIFRYRRSQVIWLVLCTVVILVFNSLIFGGQETTVLLREDFSNLDNWKTLNFPKIKKHSVYSIEKVNGRSVLKAESNASASAIVYKYSFNVYEYPQVKWRWKVSNVYVRGDARTKEGDDYPMRVYIMFEYNPEQAGTLEKMQYGLMKRLYGEYPPHSSLSYVWANKEDREKIVTSPFTDKAKMIFLKQGQKKVGTWQDENVNIVADYQKAFGTKPPIRAQIAIMNDSDNSGEHSESYMEYLEVLK